MALSSIHQISSLVLILLTILSSCNVQSSTAKHHAGRLPSGIEVKTFLQVCQLCGEFFGTKYSSACVHDKTFHTFSICYRNVYDRK